MYTERSFSQFWVRVGLVDEDALNIPCKGGHHNAQPGRFHIAQNVRLYLEIPSVVGFSSFQHGAGG